METAFLGLGSNLGDREENLRKAVRMISGEKVKVLAASHVYVTEPWGFRAETDFLNMVLKAETAISPGELLARMLEVEKELGRERTGEQYSSRMIDIDILLFGGLIINSDEIVIPHPRLHQRRFVLVPLCEIAPNAVHPVFKKSLADLLNLCSDESQIRPLSAKL